MAGQDDDDDFSDDGIDALPRNALDELENNAILHTQHQTQATQIIIAPPSSDYGDGFDDNDLDDAEVFDEAYGLPDRLQSLRPQIAWSVTQREAFRRGRYAGTNNSNTLADRSLSQRAFVRDEPARKESPRSGN